MRRLIIGALFVCVGATVGCGSKGGGSTSTPTTPTTPTATNRAPSITSMSMTPTFGIQQLTQFSFNANASDPDGDAITYAWNIAGNNFTGSSGTVTFLSGGNGSAAVTVTDSKGATATDSRSFVVGTMTGNWTFTVPGTGSLLMTLSQNVGVVTGTFTVASGGFGNVASGVTGKTDPAQPGSINAAAQVNIRLKVGAFTDFTMTGTMDNNGRTITGVINGSGFTGQPFTMTKS